MKLTSVLLLLVATLSVVHSLNPIVIKGSKFFDSVTGKQWYAKGVDYQPSADPLADVAGLNRDIPLMQALGINVIRVYQSYTNNNHDAGMSLLNNAGIYVMLDVGDYSASINRIDPQWDTTLFTTLRQKVDRFCPYPNFLAFIGANEVTISPDTIPATTYVKAMIRDLKAYIKARGFNTPVGYATADVEGLTINMESFFDCGTKEEQVDFWGINIYRWCGQSSFQQSGYAALTQHFANSDIPVMLTEFGCNVPRGRSFDDVDSLLGPNMKDVFSGGLVYEWHQEANEYGLVTINGDTATILPDYNSLKPHYLNNNPVGTTIDAYTPNGVQKTCPAVTNNWPLSPVLPPTPNVAQCSCILATLQCRTKANTVQEAAQQGAALGAAVGAICKENGGEYCAAIQRNEQTGQWGRYSHCDSVTAISLAFNAKYQDTGSCDFGGLAKLQTPKGDANQCAVIPVNVLDNGAAGTVHTSFVPFTSSLTTKKSTSTTAIPTSTTATPTSTTAVTNIGVATSSSIVSETDSTTQQSSDQETSQNQAGTSNDDIQNSGLDLTTIGTVGNSGSSLTFSLVVLIAFAALF